MRLFSRSPEDRFATDLLRALPIPVAIYAMDDDGDAASLRLAYANAAAEAATGLSAEREVGRLVTEISPDAESSGRLAALAEVARTGQPMRLGLVTYPTAHRGDVPFVAQAVPLPDGAVAVVFEDATDAEALAALQQAQAPTAARGGHDPQALLDAIGDVVVVYPITAEGPGALIAFNQAALDTYGHTAETLATMSVSDLVDSDRYNVQLGLDELMRRREGRFDSVHVTREGRRIPMDTAARLFQYGDQLCVLAVSRDDTDRRAFQRQMSRTNLDLERRVAERTAELEDFATDLKILHRITTADHDTVHERAMAYLRAGCEMFEMPIGILSSLPDDPETGDPLYRIDAVVSPDDGVPTGLTIPLADAFCDDVVAQRKTVTFADAGADARLSCHSAYAERGLRSFIGTPLWIDGALVGTLNFVSPEPRAADFKPYERELAEIMADAMARRLRDDRPAPEPAPVP